MQASAQDTSYFQRLSGPIFQVRLASLPGLNDPLDLSDHTHSKASIINALLTGTKDPKDNHSKNGFWGGLKNILNRGRAASPGYWC